MLPAGWHIPVYVWLNMPREPAYIISEKQGEGERIIFPYNVVFIPNNYKICALNPVWYYSDANSILHLASDKWLALGGSINYVNDLGHAPSRILRNRA